MLSELRRVRCTSEAEQLPRTSRQVTTASGELNARGISLSRSAVQQSIHGGLRAPCPARGQLCSTKVSAYLIEIWLLRLRTSVP
jgi:hypothetical protein